MSTDCPPTIPQPTIEQPRPAGKPWPIAEAAKFLDVCERTLQRAKQQKKIRLIKMGRNTYVPDSEVRRVAEFGL